MYLYEYEKGNYIVTGLSSNLTNPFYVSNKTIKHFAFVELYIQIYRYIGPFYAPFQNFWVEYGAEL